MAARKKTKQPEPPAEETAAAAASESDGQQEGESDTPDVMEALKAGFAEMKQYIDDKVADVEQDVGDVQEEQAEIARNAPRTLRSRPSASSCAWGAVSRTRVSARRRSGTPSVLARGATSSAD